MRKALFTGAVTAALLGAPAAAQDTTTTTMDPAMTAAPVENDGDDFPWGLLGLLGLAGLLGRKRERDVHYTGTNRTS